MVHICCSSTDWMESHLLEPTEKWSTQLIWFKSKRKLRTTQTFVNCVKMFCGLFTIAEYHMETTRVLSMRQMNSWSSSTTILRKLSNASTVMPTHWNIPQNHFWSRASNFIRLFGPNQIDSITGQPKRCIFKRIWCTFDISGTDLLMIYRWTGAINILQSRQRTQ